MHSAIHGEFIAARAKRQPSVSKPEVQRKAIAFPPGMGIAYPVSDAAPANVRAVRAVDTYDAPRRISRPVSYEPRSTRIERAPSRDWTRTAMIIGGSTAAGAGLGGIFGGKKGALIGAALGGGAATIYEVKNR